VVGGGVVTGRRALVAAAAGFAVTAVYAYLAQLRYERAFYRRFLLDTGRDPNQ
jgi:hypothetical protein